MFATMMFLGCLCQTQTVKPAQTVDQNGQILSKEPFAWPFEQYVTWVQTTSEQVKKRFPGFSPESLKTHYPRTSFERFKRGEEFGCSKITYLSDGLKVKGYLIEPRGKKNPLPVVIFNRGGNREFGKISFRTLLELHEIASWGYVVLASQYRGNDGGEGREEFGGADVNDVLNLIPLARHLENADPERIGMFGWSRGGLMTLLAMTQTKDIDAAIVGGSLANAFTNVSKRPDMETYVYSELIPDFKSHRDRELTKRSPVLWTEKLHKQTPLLVLHGSADRRVSPQSALQLAQKLYQNEHPFRLVFFEGGTHGLFDQKGEVRQQLRRWLDTYVRDGAPLPELTSLDHP